MQSFAEDCDYEENRKEVAKVQAIFTDIERALTGYLRQEIKKPFCKNKNIAKYLKRNTVALNFNYTDTAEHYTDHVVYVHGSLAEDDIILGYDAVNEDCLAEYEDIYWSKSICREKLAFRRFLLENEPDNDDKRKAELTESHQMYLHWENSGRGLDDEVRSFIPDYDAIDRFAKAYREEQGIAELDFEKVRKILVIGHGIEADKVFLKDLINRCKNLKKVVIFRYQGETSDSIRKKSEFFDLQRIKIKTVPYEKRK